MAHIMTLTRIQNIYQDLNHQLSEMTWFGWQLIRDQSVLIHILLLFCFTFLYVSIVNSLSGRIATVFSLVLHGGRKDIKALWQSLQTSYYQSHPIMHLLWINCTLRGTILAYSFQACQRTEHAFQNKTLSSDKL